MTALRERYQWLRMRIEANTMFFLQFFQGLLLNNYKTKDMTAFRNHVIETRENNEQLSIFTTAVNTHIPDFIQLLELTANTFIEFTISESWVFRHSDGRIFKHEAIMADLYKYLLLLIYTKPTIVLQPDTTTGLYHDLVKDALGTFVLEHIPLNLNQHATSQNIS